MYQTRYVDPAKRPSTIRLRTILNNHSWHQPQQVKLWSDFLKLAKYSCNIKGHISNFELLYSLLLWNTKFLEPHPFNKKVSSIDIIFKDFFLYATNLKFLVQSVVFKYSRLYVRYFVVPTAEDFGNIVKIESTTSINKVFLVGFRQTEKNQKVLIWNKI